MGKRDPPKNAASVPSADTAPSVPGSTLWNVVIKKVVFPYALPISDAKVSDNLVARDAVKASTKRGAGIPRKELLATVLA
jgi:hypothetical protein